MNRKLGLTVILFGIFIEFITADPYFQLIGLVFIIIGVLFLFENNNPKSWN